MEGSLSSGPFSWKHALWLEGSAPPPHLLLQQSLPGNRHKSDDPIGVAIAVSNEVCSLWPKLPVFSEHSNSHSTVEASWLGITQGDISTFPSYWHCGNFLHAKFARSIEKNGYQTQSKVSSLRKPNVFTIITNTNAMKNGNISVTKNKVHPRRFEKTLF